MKRGVNRTIGQAIAGATALVFVLLGGGSVQAAVQGQLDSRQSEPLTAVGNIELVSRYHVALETSGRVDEIAVEVGDQVKKGDLLIALDTANLEKSVERAELNLEDARITLEDLTKDPEASDIAVAEANLLLAQENQALVEEGPTEEEMQAAENGVAAAWARYNDLLAGPTEAQINQARAALRQAEVDLQKAQREYDKVAWLPEAAASEAADNLQRSTISFEAAKANFDEASKPTEPADLLSALSNAQSAEDDLNRLKLKPTQAELAEAKARVTAAEATLAQLNKGPTDAELASAELRVQRAVLDLDEARENLHRARVVAPIAGTVLELTVELGQPGGAGSVVATVADTRDIKLIVNVEQQDIRHVQVGQQSEISTYAYPEDIFQGIVEKISPISETGTGFVSFPVTILLIDEVPATVRPGMTANATFINAAEADAAEEAEASESSGESDQQSESTSNSND